MKKGKINNNEYKVLTSDLKYVDATYNSKKGYSILVSLDIQLNEIKGYISFYVDFFDDNDIKIIENRKYIELPTELNSKISMKIMISMNILNVIGNALLIYVFKMGIAGAAISTLISRIGSALIIIILGLNKNNLIYIKNKIMYKMDLQTIKRILSVGIPYGIENGMFYLGRLLILSLISTFGTASIAANSVSTLIASLEVLPGMAIGLGLTTIISQCVGANDYNQTKYYTKKIIAIIYVSQTITSAIMLAILPIILNIYHLSAEATGYTYKLSWYHAIMMIIWPLGYSLPVVFRASGDAKFPMIVASVSMVLCRIVLAYVFALYFKMGMVGTWIAMFVDWIVKAIIFTFRYLSGKWIKFQYS